jgi:hypothetical protein
VTGHKIIFAVLHKACSALSMAQRYFCSRLQETPWEFFITLAGAPGIFTGKAVSSFPGSWSLRAW